MPTFSRSLEQALHRALSLASEMLDSVRALSKKVLSVYPAVHVLTNNAGTLHEVWRRTTDGFEATWQVNHLAPFLLTNLLLDRLIASAPARVVTVASAAHEGARIDFENLDAREGYSMLKAYGQSKLASIVFAFELARRWRDGALPLTVCIQAWWRRKSVIWAGSSVSHGRS